MGYLLRSIIRLFAQTEQFLSVSGVFTLSANEFRHGFAAFFRDTDAIAMEPIITQITANIKLRLVVRLSADAVQLFLFGRPALVRWRPLAFVSFLVLIWIFAAVRENGSCNGCGRFPFAWTRSYFVLFSSFHFGSSCQLFGYFSLLANTISIIHY